MKLAKLKAGIAVVNDCYAKSPAMPMSLGAVVDAASRQQEAVESAVKLLDGDESPNGSRLIDRGFHAEVIRGVAKKLGLPIHPKVTNMDIARAVMKRQKRAGIPVTRTGRIILNSEPAPTSSTALEDSSAEGNE